jgi:hypothetical protein
MTPKTFWIWVVVAVATVFCFTGAVAGSMHFERPVVEHGKMDPGLPLDWCLDWGKNCGKPAADLFCRYRGYRSATHFAVAEDIGGTKLLKTGELCRNPSCDGFSYIVCERPSRRFDRPVVEHGKMDPGLPLDWCLDWGKNCGKPAADLFCRHRGYRTAVGFGKAAGAGPTKLLKTGELCRNPSCDGFSYIVCD